MRFAALSGVVAQASASWVETGGTGFSLWSVGMSAGAAGKSARATVRSETQ